VVGSLIYPRVCVCVCVCMGLTVVLRMWVGLAVAIVGLRTPRKVGTRMWKLRSSHFNAYRELAISEMEFDWRLNTEYRMNMTSSKTRWNDE